MFELSVALKYLIPKKKQLSVSLIATMSVVVISLVVWLLLVFLSVMEGIEKGWLEKLTSLNAPMRITPTPAYYDSYYYRIDGQSSRSHFRDKTIGEKAQAQVSDPFAIEEDAALPSHMPKPDLAADGSLKDPVKSIYSAFTKLQEKHTDLLFEEFELSGALMRLQLLRESNPGERTQTFLTQASYLATLPEKNPYIDALLVKDETPAPLGQKGEKVFLAKGFYDNGVRVGDMGYLSYPAPTTGAFQEQRLSIHVAGFYDPGIMSIGNKCILAPASVLRAINSSNSSYSLDKTASNGIQVWFSDLSSAEKIKMELQSALQDAGVQSYWKVQTFREYDFAKDLLEQFQSDKYLFTLLGVIILVVACCNIISLLVILVNDKKKEIGILQAMGAKGVSIATIFGACGVTMGILGCLIGTGAALLTLHNIDSVVHLLSFLQGHDAFNVAFYGKSLPNTFSHDALLFVLISTPLLSLIAGLVPAIKACRLRPSQILRSE